MNSLIETSLYSDKQGTPEEGWRIQWPKRCATKYHKDEDNNPKIQHKTYQALSKKIRRKRNVILYIHCKLQHSSVGWGNRIR